MATALERLIAEVVGQPGGEKTASAASATPSVESDAFDVPAFVERMGKTAGSLDKAAEMLTSSPQLYAQQLQMLANPLSVTRGAVHDQNRAIVASVLPEAAASLPVPKTVEEIQKSASTEETAKPGSWLRGRLGKS